MTVCNTGASPALLCAFADKRLYEGTHCVHNVAEARRYIDVTNPDAVRAFIANTYERYAAAVPSHIQAGEKTPDRWRRSLRTSRPSWAVTSTKG